MAARVLVLSLCLLGCSNEQVYNAIQENRRLECAKLPQPQYDKCMRDYDVSYGDYQRQRSDPGEAPAQ